METNDRNDYLWSAGSIAKALGVSERKAFYLLEKGLIPGRKIGAGWAVSRARLNEFMCCDA